jgi:hypothetical protein
MVWQCYYERWFNNKSNINIAFTGSIFMVLLNKIKLLSPKKESNMSNITSKIKDIDAYYRGREMAENEADGPYFDVDVAISSFNYDPPDSAFQRGYLRGLIKCGHATVISKHDGVLV